MRGAWIKAVQELMGRTTILMTRYAYHAPRVARETVQLLDLEDRSWSSRAAARPA